MESRTNRLQKYAKLDCFGSPIEGHSQLMMTYCNRSLMMDRFKRHGYILALVWRGWGEKEREEKGRDTKRERESVRGQSRMQNWNINGEKERKKCYWRRKIGTLNDLEIDTESEKED